MDEDKKEETSDLSPLSSYQVLMEGHAEVLITKKPYQLNFSELLRDLYTKYYTLRADLDKLKTGGPPDSG